MGNCILLTHRQISSSEGTLLIFRGGLRRVEKDRRRKGIVEMSAAKLLLLNAYSDFDPFQI